jgi:hypothetical protein
MRKDKLTSDGISNYHGGPHCLSKSTHSLLPLVARLLVACSLARWRETVACCSFWLVRLLMLVWWCLGRSYNQTKTKRKSKIPVFVLRKSEKPPINWHRKNVNHFDFRQLSWFRTHYPISHKNEEQKCQTFQQRENHWFPSLTTRIPCLHTLNTIVVSLSCVAFDVRWRFDALIAQPRQEKRIAEQPAMRVMTWRNGISFRRLICDSIKWTLTRRRNQLL